jgi:osmotically-inducible protein OsmY
MVPPDDDERIRQSVLDTLCHDARIDATNIAVSVAGGHVHLRGIVSDYCQKRAAEEDTREVEGIADVVDDIEVVSGASRPDCAIADDVRNVLASDAAVYSGSIVVGVINGTVYLNGTVPTSYQIEKACDDAREVEGVVNVVCHLTVS